MLCPTVTTMERFVTFSSSNSGMIFDSIAHFTSCSQYYDQEWSLEKGGLSCDHFLYLDKFYKGNM